MKGFKDFIMQGNVLDLAVGVVIGSAFTALISAFVDNLIQPVINVFGGTNVDGLSFKIIQVNEATRLDLGALLSAIIAFLITAAVVYFVFVLPVTKARAFDRKRRGLPEEDEGGAPEDVVLLGEIRDLLAAQRGGAAPTQGNTLPPQL
ncbi:large conductance mechanosensitive channel protein MscL [Brachybacterium sp. p3-SID1565]|uniref:Large conductance mechanosensitive channel protein MscL n=1 Tax=Brachybacterium epidermidis TaxID=2781983 RepID=A0ABR9W1D9_9MICO|nr:MULTISPECIES: large conductance mechanosensitive channel protein MscL [Brachybacterium]MBE9404254.1 large conductance mechanosensitive channel protein MscL [Brachybacterium epidermidis]MCT1384423.1 large conductance mechanosensitive channel protein MscL [Brachybacterium sp. p3-SID1565]